MKPGRDMDEPPLIPTRPGGPIRFNGPPGFGAHAAQEEDRESSSGVQRFLNDPRVVLALPLLGQIIALMPQMTPKQRCDLAWDHADSLIDVRRERRAAFIQGLKDSGQFHGRDE